MIPIVNLLDTLASCKLKNYSAVFFPRIHILFCPFRAQYIFLIKNSGSPHRPQKNPSYKRIYKVEPLLLMLR